MIRAVVGFGVGVVGAGLLTSTITLGVMNHRDDAVAEARAEVADTAAAGAVAVLSYRADTVDADVENAKSYLTGDFLDYYTAFGADSVAPAAKDRGITSSVTVTGSAVVSASVSDAVALVFVDQNVTSTDEPDPRAGSTGLRVELTRVDGAWLISALDPIQG